MKITLFLILVTVLVMFLLSCKNQNHINEIPDGAFLVDVRTSEEYAKGSVSNSVNIPLDQIENSLQKFESKKNIVVFCRSGNRSGKAKNILNAKGFNNVINGGSWKNVASKMTEENQ